MLASPKKVIDALAVDLSKIKWPDSGVNMFNVTLLTEREPNKMNKKQSQTFHVINIDYSV